MVDFTGGADEYLDLVGGGYRGDDEKTKALFKVQGVSKFFTCSLYNKNSVVCFFLPSE